MDKSRESTKTKQLEKLMNKVSKKFSPLLTKWGGRDLNPQGFTPGGF